MRVRRNLGDGAWLFGATAIVEEVVIPHQQTRWHVRNWDGRPIWFGDDHSAFIFEVERKPDITGITITGLHVLWRKPVAMYYVLPITAAFVEGHDNDIAMEVKISLSQAAAMGHGGEKLANPMQIMHLLDLANDQSLLLERVHEIMPRE